MLFAYLDQKVTNVINFFKSLEAKIVSVSQLSTEVLALVQAITIKVDSVSTSIADEKVQVDAILAELETLNAVIADNEQAVEILANVKENLENVGTGLTLAANAVKELVPDATEPPILIDPLVDEEPTV